MSPKVLFLAAVLVAPYAAALALPAAPSEEGEWRRDILLFDAPAPPRAADPGTLPSPEASEGIGPGSRVMIDFEDGYGLCTANFVWTDGTHLYLGIAGHCIVPSAYVATHGPDADYDPHETKLWVCIAECDYGGQTAFLFEGTIVPIGPAVYARTADTNGFTVGNDFGIILIPEALHPYVRTTLPVWGGPTPGPTGSMSAKPACLYGHGMVVAETYATHARAGVGQQTYPAHGIYDYMIPANPGDSGAAAVVCKQVGATLVGDTALGIHTHSNMIPYSPFKRGTLVAKAISMTQRDAGLGISIVTS